MKKFYENKDVKADIKTSIERERDLPRKRTTKKPVECRMEYMAAPIPRLSVLSISQRKT